MQKIYYSNFADKQAENLLFEKRSDEADVGKENSARRGSRHALDGRNIFIHNDSAGNIKADKEKVHTED